MEDNPDDTFDPRIRPWYKKAQLMRGLIRTEPYVFYTSRLQGITTAAPVLDKSGVVSGVIGVDYCALPFELRYHPDVKDGDYTLTKLFHFYKVLQ